MPAKKYVFHKTTRLLSCVSFFFFSSGGSLTFSISPQNQGSRISRNALMTKGKSASFKIPRFLAKSRHLWRKAGGVLKPFYSTKLMMARFSFMYSSMKASSSGGRFSDWQLQAFSLYLASNCCFLYLDVDKVHNLSK